jgi:hypothetical protein
MFSHFSFAKWVVLKVQNGGDWLKRLRKLARRRSRISAVSIVGFFAILIAADQWFKGNMQFAIIVGLVGAGLIYSGMSD